MRRCAQCLAGSRGSAASHAQTEPTPEKVRILLQTLSDPEVQQWIDRQRATVAASAPAPSGDGLIASQIDTTRSHIASVSAALPLVPGVLQSVFSRLRGELATQGMGKVVLLVAVFVALGYGVERLFWLVTAGVRKWIIASRLDTPALRLRAAAARFGFGASWVAAFAVGSIGAFLPFDWPPNLREVLLRLLVVIVMVRLAVVTGRLLFAPGAARFRLVPMDTPAAQFWHTRLIVNVAWIAAQYAVAGCSSRRAWKRTWYGSSRMACMSCNCA